MKYIILIITLLITNYSFSQSIWKKQADLRKENNIKESKIFLQNLKDSTKKTLWEWEFYDKNGRLVESKRFFKNGKLDNHYKFEYPTNKTRILISYNHDGKELKRKEQNFDLSDNVNLLISESKNGSFGYEYDSNGNIIKVWRIKENPKELQTEIFYNNENLKIKENLLVKSRNGGTSYISTRIYERDDDGNILKITSKSKGKINNVEIREHKKH